MEDEAQPLSKGTPKYHFLLPISLFLQETRSVLEEQRHQWHFLVTPSPKTQSFLFFPPFFCSVSRSWAASGFRFVLPLYKSPKSYSGTSKGSMCLPKYIGILPQPGCFQNLKRFKVAPFHGSEWGFCPVLFSCKFSVYNLYFLLVGHLVHSSA